MKNKNDKILDLKEVSLAFGGLKAVSNASFYVKYHEILSLIGPNGAGKTSTFNLLTGVYLPTNGTIAFKDKIINKLSPSKIVKLGMARTFQNIRLFKQLTVLENIILAMNNVRKIDIVSSILCLPNYYKEIKITNKNAMEYLEYFRLEKYHNMRAENLPYGKQRELEICRALATGAELLLLDEPAAGMNPTETDELMKLIKKLRDELNKTILLIEHDMKLVMGISDRIVVLDYGEKIAEGTATEIRNNQKVIEAYLGKSEG